MAGATSVRRSFMEPIRRLARTRRLAPVAPVAPVPAAEAEPFVENFREPRRVLVDPVADAKLGEEGFACLAGPRFLTAEEATSLRTEFLSVFPDPREGWHLSVNSPDLAYRRHIWRVIEDVVADRVRAVFHDCDIYHFAFLCKWPGVESALVVHQDWTFVDARTGLTSYGLMIALDDMVHENGQVCMVPRSHRFAPPVRGSDLYPDWEPHADALVEIGTPITLRSGEAMAWDSGTIHYGPPNLTDEPRVAIGIGLMPRESSLVYYRRVSDTEGAMYGIDERFFRTETPEALGPPPEGPALHRFPLPDAPTAADDLRRRVAGLLAASRT